MVIILIYLTYDLHYAPLIAILASSAFIRMGVQLLLALASKWILVGRMRPDSACAVYVRYRIGRLIHRHMVSPILQLIRGTVMANHILRALGAKVDARAIIDTVGVYDWDLLELGPHALCEDDSVLSGAHVQSDGMLLCDVYVDAPVRAKGIVTAGSRVLHTVEHFTASTEAHALPRDRPPEHGAKHTSSVRCVAAITIYGLLLGLASASTLLIGMATYFAQPCLTHLTDPALDPGKCLSFREDFLQIVAQGPQWRSTLYLLAWMGAHQITEPLVFTLATIIVRYALVPYAKDGEVATEDVASQLLRLLLESHHVASVAHMCEVVNRPHWILRAVGMNISAKSFVPFPKMDRPELITIGEYVSTGGDVLYQTKLGPRAVEGGVPDEPRWRSIAFEAWSFTGNGPLLLPGCTIGTHVTLGNRAVALAETEYGAGIWMGAPAQLLYRAPDRASLRAPEGIDPFKLQLLGLLLYLFLMLLQNCTHIIFLPAIFRLAHRINPHASFIEVFVPYLWVEAWTHCMWTVAVTILIKRLLWGSPRADHPDCLGSYGAQMRTIFVLAQRKMDSVADPLKGTEVCA